MTSGASSGPQMPRVVLAVGGFGTRLGALTRDRPKCLLPAGGRPFLSYVIEWFAGQGARDFLLCSGHLAGAVLDAIGDGSALGVTVRHSIEREPLGVVGALINARDLLGSEFILSYGDVYHQVPLDWLLRRAAATAAPAVMTVVEDETGNADVRDGWVVAYSKGQSSERRCWLDAGLLLLRASALGSERTEEELYRRLASAGELAALPVGPEFRPYDIGYPAGYAQFVAAVANGLIGGAPRT